MCDVEAGEGESEADVLSVYHKAIGNSVSPSDHSYQTLGSREAGASKPSRCRRVKVLKFCVNDMTGPAGG